MKETTAIAAACCAGLIVIASLTIPVDDAEAIPAFARKYRMTCTTCHAPAPRLKPYGDDFAGNGFVLEDKDSPRYTMDTGDEKLDLIRDFPIAMRFEGYVKHLTEDKRTADFTFPYNVKLLSGGSLTEHVAYYLYFFLSEHGEVAGLEDAYIMFNNVFNTELDIYVGQFQVSDPLFKREVRLTYEDYQVYTTSPGNSQIDLKYDRGIMLTYGFKTGTDVVVEITNGNGIGEADDLRLYDDDKFKCTMARISQDVGDYFRMGAFGYYGREGSQYVNDVVMGGLDASVSRGPAELNLQFIERKDSNPLLESTGGPGTSLISRGGLAELILLPHGDRSAWYGVATYNIVDYDHGDPIYHSVTGHLGYLFRTNIRMFFENTYHIDHEENRIVIGLMTAF